MPSEAVELYKEYVKAWSAVSEEERHRILGSVLDTKIVYRVPGTEGTGHSIVVEDMNEFQAKFPGGQFALHSVSEHHDVALMEWQLIFPDGTPGVLGHDAIRVTPESKLGYIVTFAPSMLEPQAS